MDPSALASHRTTLMDRGKMIYAFYWLLLLYRYSVCADAVEMSRYFYDSIWFMCARTLSMINAFGKLRHKGQRHHHETRDTHGSVCHKLLQKTRNHYLLVQHSFLPRIFWIDFFLSKNRLKLIAPESGIVSNYNSHCVTFDYFNSHFSHNFIHSFQLWGVLYSTGE